MSTHLPEPWDGVVDAVIVFVATVAVGWGREVLRDWRRERQRERETEENDEEEDDDDDDDEE